MRYLLVLLATSLTLMGQQNPITVTASAPQAVQGVNLNYNGSLGQSEVCYWVIVTYPIGNVPPASPTCLFAGATITSGNSVMVKWNSMQGATTYTLLRTNIESLPANCTNCLLISGTTQTTFTDIGNNLPSYNLTNIPSPVSEFEQLDNQNYPTPEFLIFPYPLRIGTSLIFPDGSVQTSASGTGTITTVNGTSPVTVNQVGPVATVACATCLVGTPTANTLQVGAGTQTLQSGLATEDVSGNISTPGSLSTGVGGGPGQLTQGPVLFASLPSPVDGTQMFCGDCTATNPCTGAGTGAFALRINGAWNCGASAAGGGTVNAGTINQVAYYPASASAVSGSSGISLSSTVATLNGPIIGSFTVGTLPTQSAGKQAYVTDGANNSDCVTGSGTFKVLCISDGTNWTALAYAGSASVPPPPALSTIGDFWVVRTSPTVLTIGQNCSTTFPCRVAFGTVTFQITAPATATISAGSATAYIYISDAQVLSVGTNGDTVVCSGCTTVGSISAFPPTAIPLWNWTASAGTWSLNGGTDQRVIVQKGADPLATYITQTADTQLKNAQNLAALASGCLSSTTGTGVVASSGSACGTVTNVTGTSPIASSGGATPAISITANGIGNAQLAVVQTRRTCMMNVGADNGSALANADLGPQGRQCFIAEAATVVEVTVAGDAGTPNIIPGKNHAGSITNLVSSALATASAGGIACSNTGGTTGIDGVTSCSATLQNTSVAAGDWLELVSGTAGGTAKRMSISVTYTVN